MWVESGAPGGLGTAAQPFGSLQDAVDADHCGIVLLRTGIFTEGSVVTIAGLPVTLISVDGPGAAVIDGQYGHPLFAISGTPVTFEGVELIDGYGESTSGGITTDADLTLYDCRLEGHYSVNAGAALDVSGGALTVEDSWFDSNTGVSFGAIRAGGADVVVTGTEFWANVTAAGGATVMATGGSALFDGCEFQLNHSQSGVVILGEMSTVAMHGSTFTANETEVLATLYLLEISSAELEDLEFIDNSSGGSELLLVQTVGNVARCTIVGSEHAAAAFVLGTYTLDELLITGCGGADTSGVLGFLSSTGAISRIRMTGNTVGHDYLESGVLSVTGTSSVDISNSFFNDSTGAALCVNDNAVVTLINSTVFDTRPESGEGAIQVDGDPAFVEIRNTIVAETDGYALSCVGTLGPWDYNDAYSTLFGTQIDPACTATGTGNLSEDPDFITATADGDPTNDDLHLLDNFPLVSPCVDAGDPAAAYDDADGSRNDMGAYGGPDPLP